MLLSSSAHGSRLSPKDLSSEIHAPKNCLIWMLDKGGDGWIGAGHLGERRVAVDDIVADRNFRVSVAIDSLQMQQIRYGSKAYGCTQEVLQEATAWVAGCLQGEKIFG
jgi:hypothetical protein